MIILESILNKAINLFEPWYKMSCTFCGLRQNLQHMEKDWVLKYMLERNETV